jgi:hypothetical protein
MTILSVSKRGIAAAAVACVAILSGPASSFAADVTFVMRNSHPNAVEVELYSDDRAHGWPRSTI